jgi:peroxiredoxin
MRRRRAGLLVVAVVVVGLGIGLFTSVGTSAGSGPPHAGGTAPAFSLPGVNVATSVGTPGNGGGDGHPVVVLFMGDWCTICHSEIPPLAARIKSLQVGHGALSRVAVIGVDSEDTLADAQAFIKGSGVTFPVGDDATAHVMSGLSGFEGDPYAVFIEGNGTILAIHPGPLSPGQLVSFERKLTSPAP